MTIADAILGPTGASTPAEIRLVDLVAILVAAARAHVDAEKASMERTVPLLEKVERARVLNRWPDGQRWRALCSDDFQRLEAALEILERGEIVTGPHDEKYLRVAGADHASA